MKDNTDALKAFAQAVGKGIARALESSNRAQAVLAERTGMSEATLSRVVTGKRVPSIEELLAIAAALELSLEALLGEEGMKQMSVLYVDRAHAEQLEAELVEERKKTSGLHAELEGAKTKYARLQQVLDQQRGEINEAQKLVADVEGTRSENEHLRHELSLVSGRATRLEQELHQARQAIRHLQFRLAEARVRLQKIEGAAPAVAALGGLIGFAAGLLTNAATNDKPRSKR